MALRADNTSGRALIQSCRAPHALSPGVAYMLQAVRNTMALQSTVLLHADLCGSACICQEAQCERRMAAVVQLWCLMLVCKQQQHTVASRWSAQL